MVKPLCQYFGICGGCSSQHIDYSLQLVNKKNALTIATGFSNVNVFSNGEYHYRNRMEFIFHQNGLGLRKKDTGNIIDIEECAIANEKINLLLRELRSFFEKPDYFNAGNGTFKYAIVRATNSESAISFVLNEKSSRLKEAVENIQLFSAKTTSDNVIVTYSIDDDKFTQFFLIRGDGTLKESYCGMNFLYSVQGFFQNNSKMARQMHSYCHDIIKRYNTENYELLDLYAGVGGFGIINSGLFRKVVMVENVKEGVEYAKKNIKNNNIKNAEAVLLDAQKIKKLKFGERLFIITDPPRSGMDPKTIDAIKKLRPDIILYVSCNMVKLKKDIPKFRQYKVKSAALFDFFPQTNHIESVVELSFINK